MPFGMALAVGWDDAGRSTWRPTVHEAKVPRLWACGRSRVPAGGMNG
jgi:hypothetical protein